ncbi:hypothetical protein [Pseudomonas oryzihabitans]|uniref:hypothetical protein n=1 Tax=Pseudomonas oryzihabitans TaxID=47885 RepID=UPI0021B45D43|nr:hypothetical protein [Pseudomonas psychrotolerans]
MTPSRRLPLILAALALVSLLLGVAAPPRWQGLPAAGAALVLALALLERQRPRWRQIGFWQHPPAAPRLSRTPRYAAPWHLLLDHQAPDGLDTWRRDRDQVLELWRNLAISGNDVRLYDLAPELRLLAAAAPGRPLVRPDPPAPRPTTTGDLKSALARLCRQAAPGSVILVVAPLEEAALDWLARLDLTGRGLRLWVVGTSLRLVREPDEIRDWRSARRYADAWQSDIRRERLARRLERLGIGWLAASATADLPTRLLKQWEERGAQIADCDRRPKVK